MAATRIGTRRSRRMELDRLDRIARAHHPGFSRMPGWMRTRRLKQLQKELRRRG